MEVLNAVGLTPFSLQKPTTRANTSHKGRRTPEPKKLIPFRFSTGLTGGFAALSSLLGSNGISRALTYEEALSQSVGSPPSFASSPGFDILKFGSENALAIGGGVAVLAVPYILSQVLSKPKTKPWGVETAKAAYAKLSEEADAQLLDIREGRELREVGSPDLRSLKKKAVAIVYRGEDKLGFLKKLSLKFKDPGSTTLFILDKFDGSTELVAELVTANGFKAAYAIKDGAEGARGWMNSGLPWLPPKKINFDFGDLNDVITDALGESSVLLVTLGLSAATGLGLFVFTEMETVLQVLGSAAIVQFVYKKLLFPEDRKLTLQQADEFLNTKIAPKEFVDDIKMIGKAFLPTPSGVKNLQSSAEANPEASTSAIPAIESEVSETEAEIKEEAPVEPPPAVNSVLKAELSEAAAAIKEEAPVEPPPAVNSVLKAELSEAAAAIKEEAPAEPPSAVNSVLNAELSEAAPTGFSRPLSPYPYYPDFKPPSSPSPSQP